MTDDPRFVAPKAHAKLNEAVIVRDSIFAECLYSLMVTITIMSVLMIIKLYIVTINISMLSPYIILLLALIHTFIRRSGIKRSIINLAVQLAVSVAFYFTVINISFLGFGADSRTKIYLFIFVAALTLFSFIYYLKPSHSAADTEIIFFPAAVHVVGWLFYKFTQTAVYNNDYYRRWDVTHELETDRLMFVRVLVINAVIIAFLFLVICRRRSRCPSIFRTCPCYFRYHSGIPVFICIFIIRKDQPGLLEDRLLGNRIDLKDRYGRFR